jgi:hypothetical protein
MKQTSLFLSLGVAVAFVAATSARADTIATWSFEAGQNSALATATVTSVSTGPIASDVGVGNATGLHASTSTAWSAPAGDANAAYPSSVHSLSANYWSQGDYFQFTVNPNLAQYTYSGVSLTWDQMGSNTGPKTWGLYWSTDGSAFNLYSGGDYAIVNGSWNTTTVAASHESADLSAITALDTASTMYFRVVDDSLVTGGAITGGNVATTGTGRIDNFTIAANLTPIPEPTSAAMLTGFVGLLAWNAIRRRR